MADSALKTLFGLGILAFGGYELLKYSRAHMGQQTRNLQLKIDSVTPSSEGITLDIDVLNPNTQNMELRSFVGTMLVNGSKVADVQMFGDYNVQGNSQMMIPIIAKPNVNIFSQLINLIVNGQAHVAFTGTINVNNAAIPLTLSYTAK